jgi:NAD+ kinase
MTARLLIDQGVAVTSFPNLRMPKVDHVSSAKDMGKSKVDLIITFSGDGTILRLFRSLDSTIPCLCVNVGGRGILAEIRPEQLGGLISRVVDGDFEVERRIRILPTIGSKPLSPALNEVILVRKSFAKTPSFTLILDHGAKFAERMDGVIITSPTGSTGHSFSYGSPFVQGTMPAFILTPLAPIHRFPTIVMSPTRLQISANFSLELVIDGQETYNVERNVWVKFHKHSKDAVFIRLKKAGPYRQLENIVSLESNPNIPGRKP